MNTSSSTLLGILSVPGLCYLGLWAWSRILERSLPHLLISLSYFSQQSRPHYKRRPFSFYCRHFRLVSIFAWVGIFLITQTFEPSFSPFTMVYRTMLCFSGIDFAFLPAISILQRYFGLRFWEYASSDMEASVNSVFYSILMTALFFIF